MAADSDHRRDETIARNEEVLQVRTQSVEAGTLRARTIVESDPITTTITRDVEELGEPEHVSANAQDSGEIETLADGSISIPILEEELVITKRVVVRERVILRKRVSAVEQVVEAELRSERIEIEQDGPSGS